MTVVTGAGDPPGDPGGNPGIDGYLTRSKGRLLALGSHLLLRPEPAQALAFTVTAGAINIAIIGTGRERRTVPALHLTTLGDYTIHYERMPIFRMSSPI